MVNGSRRLGEYKVLASPSIKVSFRVSRLSGSGSVIRSGSVISNNKGNASERGMTPL